MSTDATHEDRTPLRSVYSTTFSLITFVSRTSRDADIFWLDYNGRRVKHGTIKHGEHFGMNTYQFHPFIFRDSNTGDVLVANNDQEVFYPQPWAGGGRTIVFIDAPLYTLKERCLQTVRQLYPLHAVDDLEIPLTLKWDLRHVDKTPYDIFMYFQPDLGGQ